MRYIKYIWFATIVSMVSVVSCTKEENNPAKPETQTFFSISGANYHEGDLPEPQGNSTERPSISNITGNNYIVPGGTNIISITGADAQNDIKYVLVGVQGNPGYYSVNYSATKAGTLQITLILSSNLPQDTFVIAFELEDNAGNVSDRVTLRVQEAQVQRGKLEISLSWDLLNDIDLHVIQPDSEEIYYGDTHSSEGGYLDLDSNAGCSIDSVNNEHIIYPDTAEILSGTYIVKVDFYSDCVGTGTTHYGVTARYNGQLVTPTSGNNPAAGTFEAGTSDGGAAWAGVEVMRFNIQGGKRVYSFRFPNKNHPSEKYSKSCKKCK